MGAAGRDAEVLECFFFLVMVTEVIWLLLQCDQLRLSWLAAKNFDD
ncbi:hypothetical protein ECN1_0511 [Escherichia coli N1]|nr:hypothetical protein ECN1_0511 [Escherichia coli N1]